MRFYSSTNRSSMHIRWFTTTIASISSVALAIGKAAKLNCVYVMCFSSRRSKIEYNSIITSSSRIEKQSHPYMSSSSLIERKHTQTLVFYLVLACHFHLCDVIYPFFLNIFLLQCVCDRALTHMALERTHTYGPVCL